MKERGRLASKKICIITLTVAAALSMLMPTVYARQVKKSGPVENNFSPASSIDPPIDEEFKDGVDTVKKKCHHRCGRYRLSGVYKSGAGHNMEG